MTNIDKNTLLAIANWNIESGVSDVTGDVPCNYFSVSAENKPVFSSKKPVPAMIKSTVSTTSAATAPAIKPPVINTSLNVSNLAELKEVVLNCTDCNLKITATHTVFGDGKENAPVMLVGEAPGADEDRMGLPFVGKSGMLLDKMLASIGLSRTENVYISNILPWRPPGNRAPTPNEVRVCLPFIQKHIELIAPKILVLLGASAASALLGASDSISRLRGKWLKYTGIDTLVTFHPAYLLRTPLQKKFSWQDMLSLKAKYDELDLNNSPKEE